MNLCDFLARRSGEDEEEGLDVWSGKVVLVVNVASKCGFTPQYAGLQALWEKYRDRGLVVLGFPCDQFARQEPGDDAEIRSFCSLNYGVDFPLYAKIEVNGPGAHPLFVWLRDETKGLLGDRVKWNFTKFLVDREGRVVRRYAPTVEPAALEAEIEKLL
jgi:glutathione peroxidase